MRALAKPVQASSNYGIRVKGEVDVPLRLAKCCRPVPGDPIVGYISRGRGIIYHHRDCSNIANLPDPDRLVPVSWGQQSQATYPVSVRVSALDRVGLLKDMSILLAEDHVNILSVLTQTSRFGGTAESLPARVSRVPVPATAPIPPGASPPTAG
mgnify:CR=1 FL=1